ncbi:EmrB/QacA subfamily drug resistance transporter [Actinoplanes sp. SE50]|uniref:MFS transporter n=1 Tax=unclassified Actinoplanes TaxID=2626549 RepID=UPI00023EDF12|nr:MULTISPECIES: MFS transporter [unclassified Actinoplanes]AEV88259.1 drug resistance transporter, EmrB/QacA subfamily [Actinoplanes sp. SE50/110]ATO86664.1 EmrB/QacA subfamily drug resistance transporter [Actinoplanes sp. SE50]SLM04082.1 EmrB/QacA subfamily drug resistance transporter [Actinoplanes sp. SE50/110]
MSATGGAPPLSHRQILQVLSGLMLGMFLAALDQTIVASAIRTIGDDLHGLSLQAWVTTAYLITATISTPLYGKLSDIYGRKRFFVTAITIFVVGSAACSFATSMYQLAVFRAVQGLGAGGLFSLALAIIGDLVPPRERARYQGYFLAVFGASSVLGPVIGGFFAGADEILGLSGWRWVFLVNVPIGAVALVVVAKVLHLRHTRRDHRIDWWGAVALCVCLVPLLTAAEQGRTWGWTGSRTVLCYAVGAAGLVAFLVAEARMGAEALIPLRFFRNRTFALTSFAGFVTGMGMFGGLALLPLYLQIVHGASPTRSGLQLLPLTAGIMAGSLISGRAISATGRYRVWPMLGAPLMIGGMGLMHSLAVDTPYWRTGVFMGLFGLGLGFVLQPVTLAVQNAMPPQDMGVATASATFFRQMGATAGTAVFLSLLFSRVGDRIRDALRVAGADPAFQKLMADPANRRVLGGSLDDTSFLRHVDPVLARPFESGFAATIADICLVAGGVLTVALILFAFLPQVPLRGSAPAGPAELSPSSGSATDLSPSPGSATASPASSRSPHSPSPPARSVDALSLSGVVTGLDQRPLTGARLTLADLAGGQAARAVTGPDGRYLLTPEVAGAYLLICAADRHQPAAIRLTVTGADARDVRLAAGGRIEGDVVDQHDRPVAAATVTLTDAAGAVVASAITGPDGGYVLAGLYPAEYTLTGIAPGARPAARTVVLDTGGVSRADLLLAGNGTLTGQVRAAASGHPVPEASVMAVDEAGAVVATTWTDADGRYAFADLVPGAYTVTASGYPPVADRVELIGELTAHDIMLGGPREGSRLISP